MPTSSPERQTPVKGEQRIERGYPSKFMARADGYVMVRRKGCLPYVMSEKDWLALPAAQKMERK